MNKDSKPKMSIQLIGWNEIPKEAKLLVLKAFDFDVDKDGFITKDGERVIDKYVGTTIKSDNISMFLAIDGKPIVIDSNPLSISSYLEEFGE